MAQQQVCTLAQKIAEPELSVDVVSDHKQFLGLREDWDRLVVRSGIDHPFVSHTWLSTWWECFSKTAELQVFILRSAGDLVAAAPMMIRRTRMYGIPVTRLELLYNAHSPRCEFPICERHHDVYKTLWQSFSTRAAAWDVVVLPQFPASSPTLDAFEKFALGDGWRTGRWLGRPSPFVPLDCDYDSLLKRLKARERANLRRRFNKLAELGEIEFEVVDTRQGIATALADGIRIEAAAWKGKAGTAIISDAAVQQFYQQLADRAHQGGVKLTFLRVNGKRIAFHYILDVDGVEYGMKTGYDPHYHVYAPGHTLLSMILMNACDNKRREFDFLGTDEVWKSVWTKEVRSHSWLFLFRNAPFGRFLHRLKFAVVPAVRRNERLMRVIRRVAPGVP